MELKPIHVLPVDDLKEHEESASCWCNPRVINADGLDFEQNVIVHHSADGRELVEEHGIN